MYLNVEDGSINVINPALEQYENKFNKEFPLYEYLDVTSNDDYDISLAGAHKLVEFLNNLKGPVAIPKDYDSRLY